MQNPPLSCQVWDDGKWFIKLTLGKGVPERSGAAATIILIL